MCSVAHKDLRPTYQLSSNAFVPSERIKIRGILRKCLDGLANTVDAKEDIKSSRPHNVESDIEGQFLG